MSLLSINFNRTFLPGRGAGNFFAGVLLFGVATGCFTGVLNNFLVEVHHFNSWDRGVLEFFREIPGLLLVFLLALLHRVTEWKILRIGALIAMAGMAGLLFAGSSAALVILLVAVWSTGEHLLMPIRNSIAMHIARPGETGRSFGFFTSMGYVGQVAGGAAAAALFFLGRRLFPGTNEAFFYNAAWIFVLLLLAGMFFTSFPRGIGNEQVRRPRIYFRRKYRKFYCLEIFYGARKQIFITFAPMVLILVYNFKTEQVALLVGVCAVINIFGGPLVGRLIDLLGYRNIMIWDTVALLIVCLVYGFADKIFPLEVALWVVVANYVLDAIISTASMAASIYVREISDSAEEVTSTLSTGISVNHLISVIAALLGGWLWLKCGVGILFIFAAAMALLNTLYATTLPKPKKQEPAS